MRVPLALPDLSGSPAASPGLRSPPLLPSQSVSAHTCVRACALVSAELLVALFCMFQLNSLERQYFGSSTFVTRCAKCARLKQVALLFVARLRQVLARR